MAHSLTIASGCLTVLLLAGCTTSPPRETAEQRLTNVLRTQRDADAAYRSGDMGHASVLYLQLTKVVPREAEYWYMLGNTYVRLQAPDQAVEAYQRAIARNPKHTRAWHNLGVVRMRQALAAFVSSASTAKADDPMHDVSKRLADDLGRINGGNGNSGKSPDGIFTASPLPTVVSGPTTDSPDPAATHPTGAGQP